MKTDNTPSRRWVDGELRFSGGLDGRMIDLLRAIEQYGSINRAAKEVGLSYKGAWQMIERANNRAPKILVATAIGGSKGGGTCLTEAGKALLVLFGQLEQRHQLFLDQLNQSVAENPDAVQLLNRLILKTSIRNQLFGRVDAITPGAVNAEVVVQLRGGDRVVITVNLATLEQLGFAVGVEALLLINTSDVTVATRIADVLLSTPNRLQGTVLQIHQDAVDSEVVVALKGGEILAAVITQQSLLNLALQPGMKVSMIFGSSAPIIGISSDSGLIDF